MSMTLRRLVETVRNKYQAMEDRRYDLYTLPLRNSKKAKLSNLIENNDDSDVVIADKILALRNDPEVGNGKLRACVDILSRCAELIMNPENFENAKELISSYKSTNFNEDAFTKAFQHHILPAALKFIHHVEQLSQVSLEENQEKHPRFRYKKMDIEAHKSTLLQKQFKELEMLRNLHAKDVKEKNELKRTVKCTVAERDVAEEMLQYAYDNLNNQQGIISRLKSIALNENDEKIFSQDYLTNRIAKEMEKHETLRHERLAERSKSLKAVKHLGRENVKLTHEVEKLAKQNEKMHIKNLRSHAALDTTKETIKRLGRENVALHDKVDEQTHLVEKLSQNQRPPRYLNELKEVNRFGGFFQNPSSYPSEEKSTQTSSRSERPRRSHR